MSDDIHEHFDHTPIPFVPGSALVGIATVEGAPAQPVQALVIEAEIYEFQGEAVESIWIKGRLPSADDKDEYLMFAGGAEEIAPIVQAIVEASRGFVGKGGTVLPGRHTGYHNTAQIEHLDTVSEEGIGGLVAFVRPGRDGRGFELALRDDGQQASFERSRASFSSGGRDSAVTRLVGELDGPAQQLLLSEYGRLRAWQEDVRNKVKASVEAKADAPAPGL
jgi:hypothetical protein